MRSCIRQEFLVFKLILFTLLCMSLLNTDFAHAKLLQIIHTNDFHSHFEQADELEWGGYAEVKYIIDAIKNTAELQGIDTLILDGGDFSEGTPFFMAEEGRLSWKMMDVFGFEAVVIGNHDWLIGFEQMDKILGEIAPKTQFISANLINRKGYVYQTEYKNLYKYVQPYAEFKKAGLKVGVLGLSTDEWTYRWRVKDTVIEPPIEIAKKQIPHLRFYNDFVIALTHLGVDKDISLVKSTEGIDLVVGGHSHTVLNEPLYIKNAVGKKVPIVQAGAHGMYV
ncbi:MAG: metallophosphatase, partial [Deltaproteobacteria bacterium]|nr:metallophosphatase [Deltaproteobacteria bacterium]